MRKIQMLVSIVSLTASAEALLFLSQAVIYPAGRTRT